MKKSRRQRIFWIMLLGFLVACTEQPVLPTETLVFTAISPTGISTSTSIPVANTPFSLTTSPEAATAAVQSSRTPVASTPTTITVDNGLTWMECSRLKQDYAYSVSDMDFAFDCFKRDWPQRDDNDKKIFGERIHGELSDNLRIVVGQDIYETRFSRGGDGANYELMRNGKVIAKTSCAWTTFDPNVNLLNIGGKAVWEVANPSVIFVDGVNQNEKHKFEETYFPYAIRDKLIYIAKKNGKYTILYDEKVVGPEFDSISMAYCCGNTRVMYGEGQYWFWGKREGKRFVVAIY